jgi:hypothetical protein
MIHVKANVNPGDEKHGTPRSTPVLGQRKDLPETRAGITLSTRDSREREAKTLIRKLDVYKDKGLTPPTERP